MAEDNKKIIIFPDFIKLKEEVEKIRIEMSMMILERDEVLLIECKNIEMEYMLKLGNLEYKLYELNCAILRQKRKIDIIQMKKNRQEKIYIKSIEELLDKEFEEYMENLEEQMNKINEALERNNLERLTEEETKELKKLYRQIVKTLHPDLNPQNSESRINLYYKAILLYENGDLEGLRIINSMVVDSINTKNEENQMKYLMEEKKRLKSLLKIIEESIVSIKNEYPYIMKEILNDKEKLQEKKNELEDTIKEYGEILEYYKGKTEETLR